MNISTPVAPGHKYGCWGLDFPGPNTAMLNSHTIHAISWHDAHPRVVQIAAPVTTDWRPGCGHDLSDKDPSCIGCKNVTGGDSDC